MRKMNKRNNKEKKKGVKKYLMPFLHLIII